MFAEFSDKNICHYSKRAGICHLFARDQHATTGPARHIGETGSLPWAQFMFQWCIRFPDFAEFNESSAHLGNNPLDLICGKLFN